MRFVRAAGLGLAAVLALQPAATADRLRQRDAVGDVARSPIGSNAYAVFPSAWQPDIVATRVVHAPRAVWVRVSMRDLTTASNGNFHLIGITSDRRSRTIHVNAFPDHWAGSLTVSNVHGRTIACAVRHRIDYVRNRLVLKVPRACLGKPRWVRVGVRTTVVGSRYAWADDARATGLGSTLSYSRKVWH